MRPLANWFPEWAKRRFLSLRWRLDGLREQATVGTVTERLLSNVARRLEWLDVWPRDIRGERAAKLVVAAADCPHQGRATGLASQLTDDRLFDSHSLPGFSFLSHGQGQGGGACPAQSC